MTGRLGRPSRDEDAQAERELRKVCALMGVGVDKVLNLYRRIESLVRDGEYGDPCLRERMVEKSDDPKRKPALFSIRAWDHLVARNHHVLGVDQTESDMLRMTSYLVMYEALYARVIDALYEAVKSSEQVNTTWISTNKKADCLAERGLDIRKEMWPDIRNRAAHMDYAAGHGAFMTNMWGSVERVLIDNEDGFDMNEARKTYRPMQVASLADIYIGARHAATSLYIALCHWCYMQEVVGAVRRSERAPDT